MDIIILIGVITKVKVILHVDMDSFFSAIEARENPELKGLPVIVGGRIPPNKPLQGFRGQRGEAPLAETTTGESNRKIRGVVSTCSYEARAYGIHSAMPLARAYELCPDAKFLPVNMAVYKTVSASIMRILRRYADRFEQMGIDEAYLDISTKVHDWNEARAYAHLIKQEILEKEGLTCSIGIAPNKTIAKIASSFIKPDGLTVVEEERVREFLAPLPVGKIPGVGPKTEELVNQMGIETIEQLAHCDVQKLVARLGKYGGRLHRVAQGVDEREVEENVVRKSLSREMTLDEHTRDWEIITCSIDALADDLHQKLVAEGYLFKTVAIKVKFDDFSLRTRAKTLTSFHADLATLKKTAKELMTEFIARTEKWKEQKVRLVGLRVSQLGVVDEKQRRLG
ncbi:MAG: DNA polymerase IV [Methanophagales archaeon ANME-1-THS]|nr:MAG: DNA polymerase IV [Methanophagales archaeon ANME-1-THS]